MVRGLEIEAPQAEQRVQATLLLTGRPKTTCNGERVQIARFEYHPGHPGARSLVVSTRQLPPHAAKRSVPFCG